MSCDSSPFPGTSQGGYEISSQLFSHLSWTSSNEYYCLSLSKDTRTEVSANPTWLMDTFKGSVTESESTSHSVVSDSLQPHELYSPWNSPGQNPGVGSCFLLQGIFPAQRSNPGFLHCRWILYQLSHQGSPCEQP